jgi:hypothetical protein
MQYQRDKDARQVPTATPKARDLSCWIQGLQFRQNIAEIFEISSFSLRSKKNLYRSKFFG